MLFQKIIVLRKQTYYSANIMGLKRKVKIVDSAFAHDIFTSPHQTSNFMIWDRDLSDFSPSEPIFFTNGSLALAGDKHPLNVGLLLEPPAIEPQNYILAKNLLSRFNRVLTYEKNLLESDPKFQFFPHGGCWIKPLDRKIYPKSKLVSILASEKNFAPGHQLRHKVVAAYKKEMEIFGRGYNPIPYKLPALQDFMFSFVIENCKMDYYFTEKLIDCLVTGTIPIYFGCPSIHKFFNIDGFIILDSENDLDAISKQITPENYHLKLKAVQENFEKALQYILIEDWLFTNTDIFKTN